MIRSFYLLIIFVLNGTLLYSQDLPVSMKDTFKIYNGKIIKINFVDKAGREHKDAFNYFFKTEKRQYFIKVSEGNVSKKELEKVYVNNKNIKVKAVLILFGLWDTNDPNVESRVGDYLVFKEIVE